jgi:hypothetical protein
MADGPSSMRWHTVNEEAVRAITTVTNSPGVVYPMEAVHLPEKLKPIPGVSSYYVTGYAFHQALSNGLTVRGELLVARVESAVTKNYQFVFALSSDGKTYFAGPFKEFEHHHVSSGDNVPVNSLFGHTPFSRRTGS